MRIEIRAAQRDDLRALVHCSNSCATEEERRGFGGPIEQRTFASEERLTRAWEQFRVTPETVLVAEVEGEVVGFVTLEQRQDSLELDDIAVARPFQGRGVGRALVAAVEARAVAKGRPIVTLGTSRNAAGIPWKAFDWWWHQGFRVVGETRNVWTASFGGSEIRMQKNLHPGPKS